MEIGIDQTIMVPSNWDWAGRKEYSHKKYWDYLCGQMVMITW